MFLLFRASSQPTHAPPLPLPDPSAPPRYSQNDTHPAPLNAGQWIITDTPDENGNRWRYSCPEPARNGSVSSANDQSQPRSSSLNQPRPGPNSHRPSLPDNQLERCNLLTWNEQIYEEPYPPPPPYTPTPLEGTSVQQYGPPLVAPDAPPINVLYHPQTGPQTGTGTHSNARPEFDDKLDFFKRTTRCKTIAAVVAFTIAIILFAVFIILMLKPN